MKVVLGKRTLKDKIVVLEYDEGGGYLPFLVYDIIHEENYDAFSLLMAKVSDLSYPMYIDESLEKTNRVTPADLLTAVEIFKTRE